MENQSGTMKNHLNHPKTMKTQPGTMKNYENQPKTMKIQPGTIKTNPEGGYRWFRWLQETPRRKCSFFVTDRQTLHHNIYIIILTIIIIIVSVAIIIVLESSSLTGGSVWGRDAPVAWFRGKWISVGERKIGKRDERV